ncbi:hypothetical protein [Roseomonas fluvialis]|nr:hypothetical protein [Roseomonas fluvialis]
MFDSPAAASAALQDLEADGFTESEVSLVRAGDDSAAADKDGSAAATGATIGTVAGGGAGLLAGLGALAIPGVGPIVAAGWLVAALTGAGALAAAGGLIGALIDSGVERPEADALAEGVRRGGTVITVRADERRVVDAERILARHAPIDTALRADEWRGDGWVAGAQSDPPGRVASRAVDRTASTNISGAYPEQGGSTTSDPFDRGR